MLNPSLALEPVPVPEPVLEPVLELELMPVLELKLKLKPVLELESIQAQSASLRQPRRHQPQSRHYHHNGAPRVVTWPTCPTEWEPTT
jgi:hypothetical protein